MPLSPRFLLEGGWYALHQAGNLVNDSMLLYSNGRYATAAGLAMLALEELGRGRMLFNLRDEVADGRLAVDVRKIKARLENHTRKQLAGNALNVLRDPVVLEKLKNLRAEDGSLPPENRRKHDDILARVRRQQTTQFHRLRMSSFYVDPVDNPQRWSRPSELVTEREALEAVMQARNEYSLACWFLENHRNWERIRGAVEGWPERPPLPEPAEIR